MTGDLLSLASTAPAAVPSDGVSSGAADRTGADAAASAIDFERLVAGLTEASPRAENEKQGGTTDTGAPTSSRRRQDVSGIALGLVVPPPAAGSPSPGGDARDDQVDTEDLAIDVTDPELAAPSDESGVPIEAAPLLLLPDQWPSGPTSWVPREIAAGDAVSSQSVTEHCFAADSDGALHPPALSAGTGGPVSQSPDRSEAAADPGGASGSAAEAVSARARGIDAGPDADAAAGSPDGRPSTSPSSERRAGDTAAPGIDAHPATARDTDAPATLPNPTDGDRVTRSTSAAELHADEPHVRERATAGERSDVGRPRRTVASFHPGQASADGESSKDTESTAWSAPHPAARFSDSIESVRTSPSRGHDSPGGNASRGTTTLDVAPAFLLAALTGGFRGAALATYAPFAGDSTAAPAAQYGPFPAEPAQQVVKAVRLQWSEGIGEARLKLHPDHLGELTIRLRVEQGAVTASVRADSAAAAEWIRVNRADLESSLGAHGLALDTLEVVVDPDERRRRPSSPDTSDDPPPPRRRRPGDQPRFEIHV